MNECARCGFGLGSGPCETCGLLQGPKGWALGSVGALAASCLGTTLVLAFSPWLHSLFAHAASSNTSPSGLGQALVAVVATLAATILREAHVELALVIVGAVSALYVVPRRWFARPIVALVGVALGALLFHVGALEGWVAAPAATRVPSAVWGLAGGLAATPVANLRGARAAGRLAWLGAAKALLWTPLALGATFVAVYVGSALLIVVIGVAALYLAFRLLGGGSAGGGAQRSSPQAYIHGGERYEEPLLALPPGAKIKEDGQVVQQGLFWDTPSGLKIASDGRVLKEGLLFDSATGAKITDDGSIVKEGLLFDSASGVRIAKDGRLVREGVFFDSSTGIRIDGDGSVVDEGLLFDSSTAGAVIMANGEVRRRSGGER